MANPIIKIKRGVGSPVNLSTGELAIDITNKNLYIGDNSSVPFIIGGEGTFATKTYADNVVGSANTSLTQAIADEESARIAADSVLDGKITTEKNRVDAILSAADADKDSFAEIVTLINSIDTENDSAFAGYVLSNDAALAAEVSARQSADSTLTSDLAAEVTRATAAEATLTSNLSAEVTRATAAEQANAAAITAEQTARIADVDAEETRALAAESALSTRVTALETTIDGGVY